MTIGVDGSPGTPPPQDAILAKAEEFTGTEVTCLQAWLIAAQAGNPVGALMILRTGLLAEHYRSLLSEDPAAITVEQSTTLKGLLDEFKRALLAIPIGPLPYP